jgi:hypothetical protein
MAIGELFGRGLAKQIPEFDAVELDELKQLENIDAPVTGFDARDLILTITQPVGGFCLCEPGGFSSTSEAKPQHQVELGVPGSRHMIRM